MRWPFAQIVIGKPTTVNFYAAWFFLKFWAFSCSPKLDSKFLNWASNFWPLPFLLSRSYSGFSSTRLNLRCKFGCSRNSLYKGRRFSAKFGKKGFKLLISRALSEPIVGDVVAIWAESDEIVEGGFFRALVFANRVEMVNVDDLIFEVKLAGSAGVLVALLRSLH